MFRITTRIFLLLTLLMSFTVINSNSIFASDEKEMNSIQSEEGSTGDVLYIDKKTTIYKTIGGEAHGTQLDPGTYQITGTQSDGWKQVLDRDGSNYWLQGGTYLDDFSAFGDTKMQDEIVRLVNIERAKVGALPLRQNPTITNLAILRSKDMAVNNYYAHESPIYGRYSALFLGTNIKPMASGENIHVSQDSAKDFVIGWMNSEVHRENLLYTPYDEIGVGVVHEGTRAPYATQIFQSENPRFPSQDIVTDINELTDKDTYLTGKAKAGSKVEVRKFNSSAKVDKLIGTSTAGADGHFKVEVPLQKAETLLMVNYIDKNKEVSDPIVVIVKGPQLSSLSIDEVTDESTLITGVAKDRFYAEILVTANDAVIGKGTTRGDGSFLVEIPVQKANTVISVYVVQKHQLYNEVKEIIVKDTSGTTTEKVTEKNVSLLGHIKAGESFVYTTPSNQESKVSSEKFKDSVYYIKKQATYKNELYYLLSTKPSATSGTIGWMKASGISSNAHVGVDKKRKTFYVKGTGGAGFDTAWGGSKNQVYKDLKAHKNKTFAVNLTEKIGNNIWYRGILDGKQTWIHSSYVSELSSYVELSTSRLGHIKAGKSSVYVTPFNTASKKSSDSFKNSVYYIKKQATYNKELYYLLSNNPSATSGTIGWMKASDVSSHAHVGVNKNKKTLYVKGTGGVGYTRAWGGGKNHVYADLKKLKGAEFAVNLTEKIGNNIWYRGMLNGKQTWVHSSYLTELSVIYKEQSTSRLGHIKAGKSSIYTTPKNQKTVKSSESYKDSVYYIKRQATFSGDLYYLLSTEPNAKKGVIGWMKASDVSSHAHKGLDKKKKTFYVKGTGGAGFDTAWGGSKNNVYKDLKPLKNTLFHVNLTEKIGNNTWYRGMLNGKQTWIHSSYVEDISGTYKEKSTSRLGHIKAGKSLVYSSPFDTTTNVSSEDYKNSVYYIKKQATYKGELFYLLSESPSAVNGVIGWVKASDISSHAHAGVDKKAKTLYVKGTGGASYDTAWGGSNNTVFTELKSLKDAEFQVNLTEKVGNNIWYRGLLNGEQTWIHSSYVKNTK